MNTAKKSGRLWRAFESSPGLTGTTADWKIRLGDEFDGARVFLRPKSEPATSVPCPANLPCGCAHGVVAHGPGEIVAVCRCSPKRCATVVISKSDTIIYQVNRLAVGKAIAEALGFRPDENDAGAYHQTWKIGTFEPRPGFQIPLVLTIQIEEDDFKRVTSAVIAKAEGPFVLLAPTTAFWSADQDALIRRRQGRFFALSDLLASNGKLSASHPLKEVLAEFLEEVLPPEDSQFVFRRDGATWTTTFQGDMRTLLDSKGLAYIALLLGNPDQDHHASQLVAAAAGQTAAQATRERMHADDYDSYKKPGKTVKVVPVGARLDNQALREYRKKMNEIEAELKEAEGFNDTGRIDKLKLDLNALSKEVAGAVGLRGNLRESGEQAEKDRQSVSTAIERAMKVIKKEHPDMWRHLDQAVKRGQFLAYRPGQRLSWVL